LQIPVGIVALDIVVTVSASLEANVFRSRRRVLHGADGPAYQGTYLVSLLGSEGLSDPLARVKNCSEESKIKI
jgi:hypothetical protein